MWALFDGIVDYWDQVQGAEENLTGAPHAYSAAVGGGQGGRYPETKSCLCRVGV